MQLQGRPKCMALLAKNLAPVSGPAPAAAAQPPQGEPPPSLPPSPAHSDGADAPEQSVPSPLLPPPPSLLHVGLMQLCDELLRGLKWRDDRAPRR